MTSTEAKVRVGVVGVFDATQLSKIADGGYPNDTIADDDKEAVKAEVEVDSTGAKFVMDNIVPNTIKAAVRFLNYMHPMYVTSIEAGTTDESVPHPLEEPKNNPLVLAVMSQGKLSQFGQDRSKDINTFMVNLEDAFAMCSYPLHFSVDAEKGDFLTCPASGGSFAKANVTSKSVDLASSYKNTRGETIVVRENHKVHSLDYEHGDMAKFSIQSTDLYSVQVLPGALMGCIVSIGVSGLAAGNYRPSLALLKVRDVVSVPNSTRVEVVGVLLKKKRLIDRVYCDNLKDTPNEWSSSGEWVNKIVECVK